MQGFMTGTLQNFARKYQTAIDSLAFTFRVLKEDTSALAQSPSDGIYVSSLWLEGARWASDHHRLEEAKPGEMFSVRRKAHPSG